jgi:LPXTG-site transpeptidase (sortase) family protein
MTINPLDPPSKDDTLEDTMQTYDANAAADLIRDKVARIYAEEPSATSEIEEVEAAPKRSKHQQFMFELSNSGKDLVTVQTEWHEYYQSLPTNEKHEVWQEFYESQPATAHHTVTNQTAQAQQQAFSQHKHQVIHTDHPLPTKPVSHEPVDDPRSTRQIQSNLRNKVTAGGKLKAKHHVQSLLFGLGMGTVVIVIFLFGFFNEVFISPFIEPSRVAAATPIIVSSNSVAPSTTPEVIIPKINVEIPVDFSETSTNENDIESDLEQGVVHYPTTVDPGQDGNAAFFGHSSNNIFNKGKYKFAFVLLHTLVLGDTFYLTYNDKLYVYKVISRTVVSPSDVGVLSSVAGQTATATLITCDPPGTSLNRLIVVGQQISPSVTSNTQAPTTTTSSMTTIPAQLPGNGPTLWTRFSNTAIGKVLIVVVLIGTFILVLRIINKPRGELAY